MREKDFVEQNKEKWAALESMSNEAIQSDPGELAEMYNHVQNNLSYARTYYNRRSIRVYLNTLTARVFLELYKFKKESNKGFAHFWLSDLPLVLYHSRRELNISLVLFLFAFGLGIASSYHDPEFANVILGDDYVEMTENNIAAGKPMAVYDSQSESNTFFAVTINNLKVAFYTYVLGAFFAVGTLIILLYNGIMVGTFQYYFIERELFFESFLTIWMHGALEISAIVIAGAAGLCLGRGLLFPGTLPRLHAFQIGARRSIIIMIGLVPVFIIAGFIEGFFTRLTDLPAIMRSSFIALSFLVVALYFWWYPYRKFNKTNRADIDLSTLVPRESQSVKIDGLRNSREIFSANLLILRKLGLPLIGLAFVLAFSYAMIIHYIHGEDIQYKLTFDSIPLSQFYQLHSYLLFPGHFFLNLISISLLLVLLIRMYHRKFMPQLVSNYWWLTVKTTVLVGLFELGLYSGQIVLQVAVTLLLPLLFMWIAVFAMENSSLISSAERLWELIRGSGRTTIPSFLSYFLIFILVLFIVDSPLTQLYLDLINWNVHTDNDGRVQLIYLSVIFINQFALLVLLPGFIFTAIFEYYNSIEIQGAAQLNEKVNEIGTSRHAYGLEQE